MSDDLMKLGDLLERLSEETGRSKGDLLRSAVERMEEAAKARALSSAPALPPEPRPGREEPGSHRRGLREGLLAALRVTPDPDLREQIKNLLRDYPEPAPALPVAPEGEPDVPRALFLERWPEESGREDTIHYEPTGYGYDLAGHASEVHEYRLVAPSPAETEEVPEEIDAEIRAYRDALSTVFFDTTPAKTGERLEREARSDLNAAILRALRAAKQGGGR